MTDRPSNVVPLRPRPPTTSVQLNAPELKLIVAALDNAEHDLSTVATPDESRTASRAIGMLRMRLAIALHAVELAAARKEPPP